MDNRQAFDNAMCEVADAIEGEKSLVIVSSGKTTLGYETAVMLAERAFMYHEIVMLRCEDGELHEHVFLGERWRVLEALTQLERREKGEISRERLQYNLGLLLEYSTDDIVEFIASEVGRTCPCDCCGGPVDEI